MIAIEIASPGSPEVLRSVERPKPEPQPGEICIRVKAAGVARADMLQRQGKYPPPAGASNIPGLDIAGVVEEVGSEVKEFHAGDAVCAILSGGGYAEFCVAPQEQVLPIPQGWTFEEAATLPENLFTVYDNLVTRASLKRESTVLIHGGTSGIGSMALMLSRALGAKPSATAGSDAKCRACLSFGAEKAFNYKTEDFVGGVKQATGGVGVDVILDLVGAPYLQKNLQALAPEGRIAVIATQGGAKAEIDLALLMGKRARLLGSTMRARSPYEKGLVCARLREEIWPMLPGKQQIWPVIDKVFPLAEASRAHQWMEGGEHIGKIVLVP